MHYPIDWKDFGLLDAGAGEKLERWGKFIIRRPDPQAIWERTLRENEWNNADYFYHRSSSGGGTWKNRSGKFLDEYSLPNWVINYGQFNFQIQLTPFKHTALFPEQAINWQKILKLKAENILNLFAYTGGATVAGIASGASVTHVDASGSMIGIAQKNLELSLLNKINARFMKDDVTKFVEREIRRDSKYDGIIMDPPAYGRGASGELWEIETSLSGLLNKCKLILSENPKFVLINLYANELSFTSFENLARQCFNDMNCKISSSEIGLQMSSNQMILPCGMSVWIEFE